MADSHSHPHASAHAHSRSPSPPSSSRNVHTPSPPPSTSSSATAFSPPTFAIPLRAGSLHPSNFDIEKHPGYTSTPPPAILTSRLRPLRTRKLLAQFAIVAIVFFGGWWMFHHGAEGSLRFGFAQSSHHDDSVALPPSSDEPPLPASTDTSVSLPIESWGLNLRSDRVLAGLRPWPLPLPIDKATPALSSLGHSADEKYNLGASTLGEYQETLLEFIDVAFPHTAKESMKERVVGYLNGSENGAWDAFKMVWQTDKNADSVENFESQSWRGSNADGWKYGMVTDEEADKWLAKDFEDSRILELWSNLPEGILRADTIRYLLLLVHGGVYTDTDTVLLKNLRQWGENPRLWKKGEGWMSPDQQAAIEAGKSMDEVLGRPSVIVGVEADVGTRSDWNQWWPRPMQIVQWTMGSAQYHPIALSAMLRVLHNTATAIDWSHDHAHKVKTLKELGRYDDSKALAKTTVMNEPRDGGPLGVVNWTGPSVWTDAVLSYLKVKFDMDWTDLRYLQEPLRVGDVVILPVTGFSPGVGQFGAKGRWDAQAMAEHKFKGSWKDGH